MVIAGGRVVDPAQRIDAILDIRLRDGRVREIGERLEPESGERVLDARNAYVAPGFIDMHVHLREPGNPENETIATGTAAAAAGGFTAVAAMPNTNPALDTAETIRWLLERAQNDALVRVYPIGAITREREGLEPVDFEALSAAGAVAFSDDGSTIESSIVQTTAALRAKNSGKVFITHCEDAQRKARDEFDPFAETSAVMRDVTIAAATRQPWHIAHASTAGALALIEGAKRNGVTITCEVTPHHLMFTQADAQSFACPSKVHPPLRAREDVDALRIAARAGSIDAFASDHAPHVDSTSPGFSGLEIAVGAFALALPDLPVSRYVSMMSTNPARILGVPGGSLEPGSAADVTIFADIEWTVDSALFYSKGKRTPFDGMKLPRRAIATIVNGTVVAEEGRVAAAVRS